MNITTRIVWAVTIVAVIFGVLMRFWFISHLPMNSDEAIIGLMAQLARHGHTTAFYWGNVYGGTGESFITAGLFTILGVSAWVLKLTPALMSALTAIITWRIVLRLVKKSELAILAGAFVWVAPSVGILQSTVAGFRGLTLLCGVSLILLALRILDQRRNLLEFSAFGLVAGIGWWSSPEIIYLLIPSSLLVLGSLRRYFPLSRHKLIDCLKRLALTSTMFVIGALPWLWANLNSGLRSLDAHAFPIPANAPNYLGRLQLFFKYSLPMLASLRIDGPTGHWIFNRNVAIGCLAIILTALAGALVLSVRRGGRNLALAAGLVAFPVVLAVSPASWSWGDGRYITSVFPLAIMILVVGISQLRRLANYQSMLLGAVVLMAIGFGLVNIHTSITYNPTSYLMNSRYDPNSPTIQSIRGLEAQGVRYGYADYWVAYRLDFLSKGRLTLTGFDIERSRAIEATVQHSQYQAYLFIQPSRLAQTQFGNTSGLAGLSEQQFIAGIRAKHISYRLVDTDLIHAVVVKAY